jgi:Peptidase M50B-like
MDPYVDSAVLAPDDRNDWRHWSSLLLLAFALLVVWQLPWLNWLVYPFRLFGTFVHELSHGLAAIATGGHFQRFSVQPDLSGLAWSAGGFRVIVSSAGYVGSAIFGGVLIALQARGLSSRTLLLGMGVVFGLSCLLFVRNLFGIASGAVIAAGLLYAGVKFSEPWRDGLFKVLALTLVLDGYNSLFAVFQLSRTGASTQTDAHAMAQLTWLPATVWAVVWMLVSTAILFGVLRFAMRAR